ncbi:MAG: hypothetical protein LBT46_11310 [Planctomycetaceae bacterium]|nr:hypothetical protein [Planctomycetaceae bacterium]
MQSGTLLKIIGTLGSLALVSRLSAGKNWYVLTDWNVETGAASKETASFSTLMF